MKYFFGKLSALIFCVTLLSAARGAETINTLTWDKGQNSVTVDINTWTLQQLLQQVSAKTGWRVYLEPGVTRPISARFKNLLPGDALRSMIGDLNFALVPGTNDVMQLYVFKTGQEKATQFVSPVGSEGRRKDIKHVPNELIVTLKPGEKIEDLARLLGAKVLGKIDGVNAYRLQFPDEATAESALITLGSSPSVAGIDYNYIVDAPPKPQALSASTVPPVQLKLAPPAGNGQVTVGLVDTAVQSMGADLDKFITKSISVAGDATPDPNSPAHGTSMAEAILRAASSVSGGQSSMNIVSVDVYGPNPTTTMFNVASGIVTAANNGANIINLSLGSEGDSEYLHSVIQQVTQSGITVYAAAGNNGSSVPFYPAAYPEVTAVAAGTQGKLASYSNYGSYVDLVAPGTTVVYLGNNGWVVSGTSTSSALISGMTAGVATSHNESVGAASQAVKTSPTLIYTGK